MTTSHLLLLDVTPVKNIKNTEMVIKILKNGKKILKVPSQGWRHWHDEETKEAWRQQMVEKIPTFQFWDTVLRMELMGLIFVRAHHEANFPLSMLNHFVPLCHGSLH